MNTTCSCSAARCRLPSLLIFVTLGTHWPLTREFTSHHKERALSHTWNEQKCKKAKRWNIKTNAFYVRCPCFFPFAIPSFTCRTFYANYLLFVFFIHSVKYTPTNACNEVIRKRKAEKRPKLQNTKHMHCFWILISILSSHESPN